MSTTMIGEEAEVRRLAREWSRALEAKDVDAMLANYAPDALLFDVKPPFQVKGVEGYRAVWEECLPCFPKSFRSEYRELKFAVGDDVAFCHGLHRIVPSEEEKGHPAGQSYIRVTVCYRKIDGRWLVVHEHVSIPFDCMTGMVAPIDEAQVMAAGAK